MSTPRRVGLLVAFLAAASWGVPRAGRAEGIARDRDYSTVGMIVTRVVGNRTVVVIPVAGQARVRLSEPFRISNHWRLYLTVEDARLSIRRSEHRKPDGLLDLRVAEVGNDVRLAFDVRTLGDYAARPSEEGYLLWIDSDPRPALPAATPAQARPQAMSSAEPPVPQQAPRGKGWGGALFLGAFAALAGFAVRHVRRNGLPEGLADAADQAALRVLRMLGFAREAAAPAETSAQGDSETRLEFERDPRVRSADIGDAFRLEPDKPPSGIAALTTTQGTDDT